MDAQKQFNWVNVRERAKRSQCAFNFFIGGRGIGKTYSALEGQHDDFTAGECGKYIYMRLTQRELKTCAGAEDNPYKKLNTRRGWDVHFKKVPESEATAYDLIDLNAEKPLTIGTARALATFANVRGSDFDDYTDILFEEFVPTERVRMTPEVKNAGYLFSQAYETINRNRELEGQPPVRVIFLANAFKLNSDVLYYYGLIPIIESMLKTGQKRATLPERSIYIELCDAADVSEAKRETVLYKALKGNKHIENINLNNSFNDYNLTLVKKVPIVEYYPLCCYEDVTIFAHKSTGELYAKRVKTDCKEHYSERQRGLFMRNWKPTIKAAIQERTIFADNAHTLYYLQSAISSPLE